MRKIIAGLFITLDGVVEAPEKWNPPYYDDELNQEVMPPLAGAGTHLYGRRLISQVLASHSAARCRRTVRSGLFLVSEAARRNSTAASP